MGRYYSGDIEGKFWFAVQSSNDADFFGVEGEPRYLNYYYDESHLEDLEEGIKQCLDTLGENKARLDAFFDSIELGYNEGMIVDYFKEKCDIVTNKEFVGHLLRWYARLELGQKIQNCIKENGECNFEAEL